MNTHTLNEGISFSKEPKSFAGSPILKIMSNFVDAFAQAKPLYKLAFVVCENDLKGSVDRLRRSLRVHERVM